MTELNAIAALAGLGAALWIVAVVIHSMHRRKHALALWLLAVGLGVNSIATLGLPAGQALDTWLTLSGDALIALGAWAVILTRHKDHA